MATLQELLAQREALEKQIAETRQNELKAAIDKVRALIAEFGLTESDVFGKSRPAKATKSGNKVAPKYRDPATGQTWTGRGKAPKWIESQDKSKYLIA